jgi:hypothetical protein
MLFEKLMVKMECQVDSLLECTGLLKCIHNEAGDRRFIRKFGIYEYLPVHMAQILECHNNDPERHKGLNTSQNKTRPKQFNA